MKQTTLGSTTSSGKLQTQESSNCPFIESSCGNNSDFKILVTYASGYGSTGGVAEVIGKTLCQAGAEVDVKWIKHVNNLEKYDAVIIGSAIQYDRWMPEARKFVLTHHHHLSKLPVAFFFTCMTLSNRNEKTEQAANKYADKLFTLHSKVQPVSVGRFAGVLDYSNMSFFLRNFFKVFLLIVGAKEGDYRDWEDIRTWAKDAHTELKQTLANNKHKGVGDK